MEETPFNHRFTEIHAPSNPELIGQPRRFTFKPSKVGERIANLVMGRESSSGSQATVKKEELPLLKSFISEARLPDMPRKNENSTKYSERFFQNFRTSAGQNVNSPTRNIGSINANSKAK